MTNFVFNDLTHEYFLDGKRMPSVTEIIAAVIPRAWSPDPWYMERGTANHKAIALHLNGQLDESTLDPRIIGHFTAAKKFLAETGYGRGAIVERPMYSPHGFAGTPDLIAGGKLIDWKSSIEPTVEFQLGAYSILAALCSGKALAVELSEDGKYKIHAFDVKAAQRLWMNLFSVYGWMNKNGLLPKKEG
jgi:hypothetical protein